MEYLDVVDEDDALVGKDTRENVHCKGLIHRTVMFFIFNLEDKVFVNQRAKDKEFFGGYHSIVLGGHVVSGQTYDEAVRREAYEEAKMTSEPFYMGSIKKRLAEESENVAVYGFKTEKEPHLDESEVIWGEFMDLNQLREYMRSHRFLPETKDLLPILEKYYKRL